MDKITYAHKFVDYKSFLVPEPLMRKPIVPRFCSLSLQILDILTDDKRAYAEYLKKRMVG